jgi:hypothetical protein
VSDRHDAPRDPSDPVVRTAAIEALRVEQGLIATDTVDAVVEMFEMFGPLSASSPGMPRSSCASPYSAS